MKLKQKLLAVIVAVMTTTSVLADTGNAPPVVDVFTSTDMASLFEQDTHPLQLVVLSEQEMKVTQDAWKPWGAVIGSLGGLGGYAIGTIISGAPWLWEHCYHGNR